MNGILTRIDAALERMKNDGAELDNCPHYERLKAKRDAIENGAPYATYNVAPYLIRVVGAQIPNCNMAFDGRENKTIKARGDWAKVVAPAYLD